MLFDILYKKEIKRLNDKHTDLDDKLRRLDSLIVKAENNQDVRLTTIETEDCSRLSNLTANQDLWEIFEEYIDYIAGLMDSKFFLFFLTDIREELLYSVSNGEMTQIEIGKIKQYDHLLKQIGKFRIIKEEIQNKRKES